MPVTGALPSAASALLLDPAMSLAVLRPGDLFLFSSGSLHFATNGEPCMRSLLGGSEGHRQTRSYRGVVLFLARGMNSIDATYEGSGVHMRANTSIDMLREARTRRRYQPGLHDHQPIHLDETS